MKLESYSQNLIEQNTRPPPFGRGENYMYAWESGQGPGILTSTVPGAVVSFDKIGWKWRSAQK